MPIAIHVENISKRYRIGALEHESMIRDALINLVRAPFTRRKEVRDQTIMALDDINFEVNVGEVVGIIGRNGAGKSTLLKVLSKITYPTSGRITVNGRVAALIEVGTGFHEELTGRENIYLNGSILGMKKREIKERIDAIIDFAGVDKFVDTPIKRYSSGMRLRLGFAVAAHMSPDVLFVDEVLAVGDVEFQKKCLNAMDEMRVGGRTVLFVSHNMAAIENLCPRTLWIDGGKIRQDGETSKVISSYLSTFAQTQRSGYDLTDVESRGGTGEVRFTGVEFMDESGAPTSVFRCGEPLKARMTFAASEEVKDPHFVFQIFNEMGTLVTTACNWHSGYYIPSIKGEGCIDLEIPNLNILPNRYFISLWISSQGQVLYDSLDHILTMDIETSTSGENFGRGMHSRWGLVHTPNSWTLPSLEQSPKR